jgi:hypothetical protein
MPKATNTKGLTIYMTKGTGITPVEVVPTAISKASPAVVTVADTAGVLAGDVATPKGTGFPELDGHLFVIGTVDDTAKTFTLLGADTTASLGALGATPAIEIDKFTDMVCLCWSEFTINRDAPDAVEAGTYCDPSLTVASAVSTAGTLEFKGNVDVKDPGYKEMIQAERDGKQREIRIAFPQDNGYVVAPLTLDLMNWEAPLDGVVKYAGSGTLLQEPQHVF